MFNQFHDILGGAYIKDAYDDAYNGLGRATLSANEMVAYNLQAITKNINMPGKNPDNAWNVVVWNLNASEFDGYLEAEVQWLHEFDAYTGEIYLEDEFGEKLPCQIILEKSVITGFRSRFIFKAKIPAFGYRALKVVKTNKPFKKDYAFNGKIEKLCQQFSFENNVQDLINAGVTQDGYFEPEGIKIRYGKLYLGFIWGVKGVSPKSWRSSIIRYN
jgi:hypothetical protein